MKVRTKFLVGSAIIVLTLISLAYVGFTQSKTYYHTIAEVSTLQGPALRQRMRVSGNVRNGTIQHFPGHLDFVLEEEGRGMAVRYVGTAPLPDTFKDGALALVEGQLMPDGHFEAEQVQAKCASKYQANPNSAPGVKQPQPGQTSTRNSSGSGAASVADSRTASGSGS